MMHALVRIEKVTKQYIYLRIITYEGKEPHQVVKKVKVGEQFEIRQFFKIPKKD